MISSFHRTTGAALFFALSLALFLTGPDATAAAASTRYVSNTGFDSGVCGSDIDPCRSISRAIANAPAGSTISVGPGRYGDLDDDGTLGETGEELDASCGTFACTINVTKEVTIVSEAGAFSTVIDPGTDTPVTTVMLSASGAVLGAKNKGFTIYNRQSNGRAVAVNDGVGDTLVSGNVLIGEGGFRDLDGAGGARVVGNRVLCTGDGTGINSQQVDTEIVGNTVSGCYYGASLMGANAVVENNVFHANVNGLDMMNAPNVTAKKNSFIGNSYLGVVAGGTSTGTITQSNFVGNGVAAANCGIDANNTNVTITDSWWGALTGPGAEPADDACDELMGAVPSFADKPIKVKPKPIR